MPSVAALSRPLLWEKKGDADLGRPLRRGSSIIDRVVIYRPEHLDRLFANIKHSTHLGSELQRPFVGIEVVDLRIIWRPHIPALPEVMGEDRLYRELAHMRAVLARARAGEIPLRKTE